ncbi:hypothetical protein AFERRI_390012 [Acidithiobacillus ferrivorans]|uniref:Uncharacterized protein n=1 Tax=Acidithiobacillus ferrivorans TaxID=160808 RepID=A0A060UTF3_9PROT|nr:hypothetical protein AFERRI_390012 [Acidithiobacillus ferrivorans]
MPHAFPTDSHDASGFFQRAAIGSANSKMKHQRVLLPYGQSLEMSLYSIRVYIVFDFRPRILRKSISVSRLTVLMLQFNTLGLDIGGSKGVANAPVSCAAVPLAARGTLVA